jgi:hypothetical protein
MTASRALQEVEVAKVRDDPVQDYTKDMTASPQAVMVHLLVTA